MRSPPRQPEVFLVRRNRIAEPSHRRMLTVGVPRWNEPPPRRQPLNFLNRERCQPYTMLQFVFRLLARNPPPPGIGIDLPALAAQDFPAPLRCYQYEPQSRPAFSLHPHAIELLPEF